MTEIGKLPENLQGAIVNDCSDENARGRQTARFRTLFGFEPTFVGLGEDDPDLEAAGQVVDLLDSTATPSGYPDNPAVILFNVAPRGDDVRENWENGTPFAYAQIDHATIFGTYEGRVFPVLKRLGLVEKVAVLDIPTATEILVNNEIISAGEAADIRNTQFRSRDFLPLAAREIMAGRDLRPEKLDVKESPDAEGRIWLIDNFGNGKTTTLPEDIGFEEGEVRDTKQGKTITPYKRLADVPTGELGLIIGSSGYKQHRWLEVVKQKGSAADDLGLKVGTRIDYGTS